jgi:transcriptional regulator with XRE-family HTH domain
MLRTVYNVTIMEFWEWMNKQYIIWRGEERGTISEFAEYIGVRQSVMSKWMSRNGAAPSASSLAKIASKLGLEVYDVLGLPRPDFAALTSYPPEIVAALTEINEIYASRHISPDSPEALEIAKSILSIRLGNKEG